MAHAHDQTLDDQCPRHFHLHLCPGPSTPLAKNLQVSDFLKSGKVFAQNLQFYQKKQTHLWKKKIYYMVESQMNWSGPNCDFLPK